MADQKVSETDGISVEREEVMIEWWSHLQPATQAGLFGIAASIVWFGAVVAVSIRLKL